MMIHLGKKYKVYCIDRQMTEDTYNKGKRSSGVYLGEYLINFVGMNVKHPGPVALAYTVTYMTRPLWEVSWPRKAQERYRTLFFKCILPDSLHVSFFSASSSYWSYK